MATLAELKEIHKGKKGSFQRVMVDENGVFLLTEEWIYNKPLSETNPLFWVTGVNKGKNREHTRVMRKIHNQLY